MDLAVRSGLTTIREILARQIVCIAETGPSGARKKLLPPKRSSPVALGFQHWDVLHAYSGAEFLWKHGLNKTIVALIQDKEISVSSQAERAIEKVSTQSHANAGPSFPSASLACLLAILINISVRRQLCGSPEGARLVLGEEFSCALRRLAGADDLVSLGLLQWLVFVETGKTSPSAWSVCADTASARSSTHRGCMRNLFHLRQDGAGEGLGFAQSSHQNDTRR